MLIQIHPDNPSPRQVQQVAHILRNGGVIIYPTDTVYGLGCDITNRKAVEQIARIKGIDLSKAHLSFICADLSHLSNFTKPISNSYFKLMKSHLPGPFTFILEANNTVPKLLLSRKKTVGIRVPDNNIIIEIVRELGNPIITTSIHDEDEVIEYTTDPELIHEKYSNLVDCVVDGGYGGNIASTVVDLTGESPVLLREGLGILAY